MCKLMLLYLPFLLEASFVDQIVVDLGQAPTAQLQALGGIFSRVVGERSNATVTIGAAACSGGPGPLPVLLRVNASLGREAFSVSSCGAAGGVVIAGGDALGLVFGVGQFLHGSQFEGAGVAPSAWRGESAPQEPGSMRAAYLATHFENFYQAAPPSLVAQYVEDLALWGLNTLLVTIPLQQFTGLEDASLATLLSLLHSIFSSAKAIGIGVGIIHVPNQGFRTRPADIAYTPFPDPLGVRGHLGFLTCAHTGRAYLEEAGSALLSNFSAFPLDVLLFWPYDDGGCGCSVDWPWGGRGFPNISAAILQAARAQNPALKAVISTWMYDQPVAGEFDGLDAYLRSNAVPAFDAVMADNHADFPSWPLQHNGAPGGLPLYNFPEISMWGRYPWGGFGANPLPLRFQALWNETKGLVTGGAPYSEGIFEDMNMVIALRHYWNGSSAATDTLKDYAAFEYGALAVEPVAASVATLESNWPNGRPASSALNVSAALEAVDAAMQGKLRVGWRWRLLLLRARIDKQLFLNGRVNCSNPLMVAAFKELSVIYYAANAYGAVRPPCT